MNELWIAFGIAAIAAAIGGLVYRKRQEAPTPVVKLDIREVRLSRQLARTLGCPASEVLPAVRQEIDLGSHLPDETILKRAKYHYQQNLPEKTCNVYRDSAAG